MSDDNTGGENSGENSVGHDETQRNLSVKTGPNSAQFARWADALLLSMDQQDRARAMSDGELCDAVIDKVWAKQSFFGEEIELLDELIARFERRCGIRRDEETGEIVANALPMGDDGKLDWNKINLEAARLMEEEREAQEQAMAESLGKWADKST